MKRLFIIGLTLCIIGCLLFGIGLFMGGKKDLQVSNQSDQNASHKNTYVLEKTKIQTITNVQFDLSISDLIIKASEDSTYYLSYYIESENTKNPLSYKVENNTLTLQEKEEESSSFVDMDFFEVSFNNKDEKENEVVLYIPKNTTLKEISGKINVGDLEITRINCDHFDVKVDVGDVNFDHIQISNGDFSTNVGDIDIVNSNLSNLDISSNVGDIQLEETSYQHGTIDASTGSIYTSFSSLSGDITITNNTGDIDVELPSNVVKESSIHAETSVGDLTVSDTLQGNLTKDIGSSIYDKEVNQPKQTITLENNTGDISIQTR